MRWRWCRARGQHQADLSGGPGAAGTRPAARACCPRTGTGFDVHVLEAGPAAGAVRRRRCRTSRGWPAIPTPMSASTRCATRSTARSAEGDIGRHFPPSEAHWKDADSARFLRHAAERIAARGGMLANADVTLICERPKITPHAPAMMRPAGRAARGRARPRSRSRRPPPSGSASPAAARGSRPRRWRRCCCPQVRTSVRLGERMVAGGLLPGPAGPGGLLDAADLRRAGAARMEMAARRRRGGGGDLARHARQTPRRCRGRAPARHRAAGAYRDGAAPRTPAPRVPLLDDAAEIHHRHAARRTSAPPRDRG